MWLLSLVTSGRLFERRVAVFHLMGWGPHRRTDISVMVCPRNTSRPPGRRPRWHDVRTRRRRNCAKELHTRRHQRCPREHEVSDVSRNVRREGRSITSRVRAGRSPRHHRSRATAGSGRSHCRESSSCRALASNDVGTNTCTGPVGTARRGLPPSAEPGSPRSRGAPSRARFQRPMPS
jgi:hypothetical protein